MSEEAEIVKAILELKQESNPLKDYIYPIAITFFSVILGAFFAHYSVKYQKYIDAQKEKLEVANDWVVKFQGAFESLISFKRTYHGKLNEQPLSRMSSIQEIIHSNKKMEVNVGELSFLVPGEEDPECEKEKWRSLPRINSMVSNYNFLIETWDKRNKLAAHIIPTVIKKFGENGVANVNLAQLADTVGQEIILPYIDLTEYAIKLTDELLIEIYDFASNFGKSARWCIDVERIKYYGKLLNYKHSEHALPYLERSPEVDYQTLAQFYSSTPEIMKERYFSGYEELAYKMPQEKPNIDKNIEEYKLKQALRRKHFRWW